MRVGQWENGHGGEERQGMLALLFFSAIKKLKKNSKKEEWENIGDFFYRLQRLCVRKAQVMP